MPRPRNLHATETAQFKIAIDSNDLRRSQRALQELCKLYREGAAVHPNHRSSVETVLIGVLMKGTSDERVRRWSLSAIGFIGTARSSMPAVLNAIDVFRNEPQVVSAGIAAVFKLNEREANSLIISRDFLDPKVVVLSALQTASPGTVDTKDFVVNIERESELIQRLALVAVGLGRAPANIFHPKYSNREIVKILGRSGEPMVSQYAVWATAENKNLNADDLGISPSQIDDHPPNVQSYIFRLHASAPTASDLRHELIARGTQHAIPKVRLGTAIGLRDAFYDGLEPLVTDWIVNESDIDVREYILDHVVRQASKSSVYEELAREEYGAAQQDEGLRQRMRAAAVGQKLYSEFAYQIHVEGEGLFGRSGVINLTANNSNFGNVQGNTSFGGEASNYGNITNNQIIEKADEARKTIELALTDVQKISLDIDLKSDLTHSLEEAKVRPTRDTIGKAQGLLTKAKDSLLGVGEAADAVVKLAGYGALLASFLL